MFVLLGAYNFGCLFYLKVSFIRNLLNITRSHHFKLLLIYGQGIETKMELSILPEQAPEAGVVSLTSPL